jgi:nanoRNase/pAp phosphatase (c-di-AMP/oligoRNAs hydrolase)
MYSVSDSKYRLVTRSDFDGLVCAVLLKHLNLVDEIKFVHPKDMQDGKVEVSANDITTNLPFVPAVYMAFDHHLSEMIRNDQADNYIIDAKAPSAARVVFEYYGGYDVFPKEWEDMLIAVDIADSAQYERHDILDPQGWSLLNFLMDARTGLGRFRDFRISNYELMMDLIDYCKDNTIENILELPDVKERVELYMEQQIKFVEQIKRCSKVVGNLVILDLLNEQEIWAGNRFMIYALFPEVNISIHKIWGIKKQKTVYATGKSIFNRSSKTNVGELMLKYDGGGHEAAGTCQIDNADAEAVLDALIEKINSDG